MERIFLTLILSFICLSLKAQAPLSVFWEPEFSYTWSASSKWTFNTKLVGRTYLYDEQDTKLKLQRNEIHLFATRNLFGGQKISGGYLYRYAEPFFERDFGYEHRLMQQYAFVSFITDRRISHRIRTEQRIRNKDYFNRLRYRASYDFPLTGEQLDPGETYLILSNEVLFSFNSQVAMGENRVYCGLGWYFSRKTKLEVGLQYRAENIGQDFRHVIQVGSAFYLNQ
ncbi:MAG: DUF2490 domain-containing protein [Candidatus Cyclobacteriaceae bacterium M3_2C_046]